MTFINWGHETPEQKELRRRLEEQELFQNAVSRRIFEQRAAANSASAAAGVAGSGRIRNLCENPNALVGTISWAEWAPGGSGSADHDFENFNTWATETFPAVTDVVRLVLSTIGSTANAHLHGEGGDVYCDLKIELYNNSAGSWVTVWSTRLTTTDDYYFDVDITFPAIAEVTQIRLSSDPGQDQTYHEWNDADFELYRCGTNPSFYAYGRPNAENPENGGIFQKIDAGGNITRIGTETFLGDTVLCRNTDNDTMYYITQDRDVEEMIVGIINVSTGVQTELDRNALTARTYRAPASLVYTGNNTFVYLAGSSGSTQDIIEIQIIGSEVITSPISVYASGNLLTGLFKWNNEWWTTLQNVISEVISFASISSFNIETGEILDSNFIELTNYPFSEMYKVIAPVGLSQAPGGKIYVTLAITDKDTNTLRLIVAELDPENYSAAYVATVNFNVFGINEYAPYDIEIV